MIFFISIYLIGILAFAIHYWLLPPLARTREKLIELLLLYQIVFSIGITSLVAFFGLTFMGPYIADYTGWPASPFEQQLANVNLGYAVLGLLAIWFRKGFWAATVIGFSVWILSDGIHHLYHYLIHHNAAAGNIGVPLWTDFIVPIFLLILLKFYKY